jgi:hypothetical protein
MLRSNTGMPNFVPSAITGDDRLEFGVDAESKGVVLEGRGIWGCSSVAGRNSFDRSTSVGCVKAGTAA